MTKAQIQAIKTADRLYKEDWQNRDWEEGEDGEVKTRTADREIEVSKQGKMTIGERG